ncbi:MAG: hypothetical protein IKB53_02300 [Oscillospiraceae bacterium]|nr:hypothetical protein [Oscillospiraceae bacterium]
MEALAAEEVPAEEVILQADDEADVPTVEQLLREMELRHALLAMRQQDSMQQMAMRQAVQQAFFERDVQDFLAKHPEVDIVLLDANPIFRRFCGSRYGMESLAKLYEDYREIVNGAEKAARAAVQSRSKRSTGSGGGGGDILTAKQRASLEAWNRANPDMKMTAREFLNH